MKLIPSSNRGRLIAALLVGIVIIGIITAVTRSHTTKTATTTPTYTGLDILLTHGVSANQIDELKFALYKFSQSSGSTLKSVAISNFKSLPYDVHGSSMISSITTTLVYNDTTYFARMDLTNITSLELHLSNPKTNTEVFDSGLINTTTSSS